MRKGYLNKLFRMDVGNGLSDLLAGKIDLATATHSTEVENLHVITRGQIPPNPSELLMHSNFTQFLEKVSSQYDLVIIDTPPILAVTDAALVGRQAGTSLIVTRFGVNAAKEIQVTKRRFEQNGVVVKGAIFNAVQRKASAYGYGNYSYYQYEYASDKNSAGYQGSVAALIYPGEPIPCPSAPATPLVPDPVQATTRLARRRKPYAPSLQVLPPHPTRRTHPTRPPHQFDGIIVPWIPIHPTRPAQRQLAPHTFNSGSQPTRHIRKATDRRS